MCPPFMKLIPVATPWRTLNIPISCSKKEVHFPPIHHQMKKEGT